MITFNDSDFFILSSSLLYHKFLCETLLKKEVFGSDLYLQYSLEIKQIDSLLSKINNHE